MIEQKKIQEALNFIRDATDLKPRLALILGSGLGEFSKNIKLVSTIFASEIPNYPASSVHGHAGKLIFGYLKNDFTHSTPLLIFQGRIHFYEFGCIDQVLFPAVIAYYLGIKKIIITNAAGGLNRCFSVGDFMLIKDILNFTFLPLHSNIHKLNYSNYVPKEYFDPTLQKLALHCASLLKIPLQQGTYC